LVSERLEERDLFVGEGTHFASADEDRANRDALTQQSGTFTGASPSEAEKTAKQLPCN
jgi:hypothetical protein